MCGKPQNKSFSANKYDHCKSGYSTWHIIRTATRKCFFPADSYTRSREARISTILSIPVDCITYAYKLLLKGRFEIIILFFRGNGCMKDSILQQKHPKKSLTALDVFDLLVHIDFYKLHLQI